MRALPPLVALILVLGPALAAADAVVPSERVRNRVIVRDAPSRTGRDVGSLRPGQRADYLGAASGWRRVRLADGTVGFVSEPWTLVAVDGSEGSKPARGGAGPSFWSRLGGALGLRSAPPDVDFVIRDPDLGPDATYRNTDPGLPVSGFAKLVGASHLHDIVIAIDVSGSTNEFAEADVDGDGRLEDSWKGRDSIFRAQLAAAHNLVGSVERMPHNEGGQRIRVGLVTYSGAQRFDGASEDVDLEISSARILRLAARDAELALPLTGDYGAARRALARLARLSPEGMTDVAAGIGRAIVELEGLTDQGARSRSRPKAQKVILLLTDGKPSLPYDRPTARRAASYAGDMARARGVRINAFAIGAHAVKRSPRDAVRRMARNSGGRYVALAKPADVVSVLQSTSFSIVERVEIANRTTGHETRHLATGIDGSFYGEIQLAEGENEIEVAAVLTDDREARETFTVEFVRGRPTAELTQQLTRIRTQNEALIERIKDDLAREMAEARRRQRKNVQVVPANQD
jgi:predicted nucleic acid-binding protein